MIAGDPPFTGATVNAIVAKVMSERPTALHVIRDTVHDLPDVAVNICV